MKKLRLLSLFTVMAVLLSGCSGENPSSKEEVTATTTTEQTAPPQPEVNKMELYKDNIVVLPPEGYDKARQGIEYPKFDGLSYYSTTVERDTYCQVLLPPGYDESKEYPVLYVLHGFYDNAIWMTRPTVALSEIYNNLLKDGKAKEMIIVSPNIFCSKEMVSCTGMDLKNCLAYDNFINELVNDLMPAIEENYSVAKGRENTAITGFSMGGRESLFIGITRPDLFSYIGAVCPAPGLVEVPGSAMHPGQITREQMKFEEYKPDILFISSSKADGTVGHFPDSYRQIFTENETEYLTHVMESAGHDPSSVKPHLYNFLQMLF